MHLLHERLVLIFVKREPGIQATDGLMNGLLSSSQTETWFVDKVDERMDQRRSAPLARN